MKLKLANSLAAGIARLKSFANYYQWLFTTKPDEIVNNEYTDYGTGGNNGLILNTTIATFDGTAYLQGEVGQFAGYSIYAYQGASVPTIDYVNNRINLTAGNSEWVDLIDSNGNIERIWFQEGNGLEVYSTLTGNIELVSIQNVFTQSPILKNDKWVFEDITNNGNDVENVNGYSLSFNGIDTVDTLGSDSGQIIGTQPYTVHIKCRIPKAAAGTIFSRRQANQLNYSHIFYSETYGIQYREKSGAPLSFIPANQEYITITAVRGVDTLSLYEGTELKGTVSQTNLDIAVSTYSSIGAYDSRPYAAIQDFLECEVFEVAFYMREVSNQEVSDLNNLELIDQTGVIFHKHYCRGGGDTIQDLSVGGRDSTVLGALNWANLNVVPYAFKFGFSLNGSEVVPAMLDGILDADGNAIQYQKDIGIVDGLPNEYVIPVNADLNDVIPSGQYPWQQLRDLVQSAYLIKTEDSETIGQMVVKKKANKLSVINDVDVINDNTVIV